MTKKHICNKLPSFMTEVWLVFHLTIELLNDLGGRVRWIWMAVRFFVWVALLTPAFWRTSIMFILSDYIKRNICYGPNPRNFLDIYVQNAKTKTKTGSKKHLSKQSDKKPVVVFMTGGAWIIGYKAWGAFMGMLFSQLGVIFVSPDYRNFPQGTIDDMMEDCSRAVQWTFDNIERFGGDKHKIYLISQSAGAHISTLTVLKQAFDIQLSNKFDSVLYKLKQQLNLGENSELETRISNIQRLASQLKQRHARWNPLQLKGFVAIAGPHNLLNMKEYLNNRGLYDDILNKIMGNDLMKYSPYHFLKNTFRKDKARDKCPLNWSPEGGPMPSQTETGDGESGPEILVQFRDEWKQYLTEHKFDLNLCPVYLYHGDVDQSVPVSNSISFAHLLSKYNVETHLKIYANQTHTASIIENPIAGTDPLVCDLLNIVYPNERLESIVKEVEDNMKGTLIIPQIVIDIAQYICPF